MINVGADYEKRDFAENVKPMRERRGRRREKSISDDFLSGRKGNTFATVAAKAKADCRVALLNMQASPIFCETSRYLIVS